MKTGIAIIALVCVVALGAWAWHARTVDEPDRQSPDASWETYESDVFGFSIDYPPEASVQREAERYIKFTYLGGPQATGEVTDGFTLTVGTHDAAGAALEAFAQSFYDEQLRAGSSVTPPERTEWYGGAAYRYQVETLGVVTTYVVAGSGGGRMHTISYHIADPRDEGYRQLVESMLASFQTISAPESGADTDVVSIAVLDIADEGAGERHGCDFVAYVERSIAPTTTPLAAALRELFALSTTDVGGYYHFIARTNDTLSFERAEVRDGTAHIYLRGELSGLAGVCDDPRARIQIEQTALQFATVDEVVLYLNGNPTELVPSQR